LSSKIKIKIKRRTTMITIKNTATGEKIEAIGVWIDPGKGVCFLSGQGHELLSDPRFTWGPPETVYDTVSEEDYDCYQLPTGWEFVDSQPE
jgi:hypothetical protein